MDGGFTDESDSAIKIIDELEQQSKRNMYLKMTESLIDEYIINK